MEEMAAFGTISSEAKEFSELYKKARITREPLSLKEIEKVCYSLKNSFTLENLDRTQLVSLCKYMDVKAFGTDTFLRYQIRNALKKLYLDDQEIASEGVDSLYISELEQACRLRGLFYPGIDENSMREELNFWLELHLKKGLPSVILILARALSPNMKLYRPEEALKETILSLPEAVVNEAELHQQEISGSGAISFKQKLEVLERQQNLIDSELAQEAELKEKCEKDINDAKISKEDLKILSDALSIMSSDNPVKQEELELQELKENVADFRNDMEELEHLTNNKLREPKAAEILGEKIEKIIEEVESDLQSLNDRLGARLNLISTDAKGQISIDQLNTVLKLIRHSPSESDKLDNILKTFDADKDGKVFISDIIEMAKKAEEIEGQGKVVEEQEK
jgi:LETM1 and EF-hand domain-containing protein 1, mitochondrial